MILVLLAGLVAPRVIGYLGSSRSKTAKVQIESLITALELYKLDSARFPGSDEGLKALVENPGNVNNWNGPYLRNGTVPKDPWGNDYRYRFPGEHGDIDMFSLGKDNEPGGSGETADITSWETAGIEIPGRIYPV